MSELAGEAEMAAVGFDYGFADGQSHASSVDLHALVPSTIKFFEDKRLLKIVDAWAAIGNADVKSLILGFRGDADRSADGRVFCGVFDQVYQNLLDVRGVHARVRKAGGDSDFDRVLREKLLEFILRFLDRRADGCGCEAKFNFVGIQLGHLGGFSDQPIQPITFLIDNGQQFLPFLGGMSCRIARAS